ncbi:MAG: hypothetical protein ACLBM4_19710 [Dolichospermum sp.]
MYRLLYGYATQAIKNQIGVLYFMLNFLKNIALRAAFLAAGDENREKRAISRNHIIKAIRLEYQKQNKILMTADLGDYA